MKGLDTGGGITEILDKDVEHGADMQEEHRGGSCRPPKGATERTPRRQTIE